METDRAWALTAALLGIHQAEEVALSIRRWSDRVGPTGWRLFDEHMRRNPLAGYNPWGRAAVVAGQGAALYGLYRLTRADAARTRAVTTALTLGWGAAFCMHLGVSWRTRSFMPGTATSIVPGLPGAVFVLWRIRSLTRPPVRRRTSSRLFDESRPEVVILIVAGYDYPATISARRGPGC